MLFGLFDSTPLKVQHIGGAILLLASAVCAAPATAAEPLEFTPSGKWTADFAEDNCALRRMFGRDGKTVFLEFRKYAPGASMEVSVGSDTLDFRPVKPATRFLPDSDLTAQAFYVSIKTETGWNGVTFWESLVQRKAEPGSPDSSETLEEPDRARLAAISAYELQGLFDKDIELMTGSLEKTADIMQSCLDDLVSSWGVDPAAQRTLSRKIEWSENEAWMSRLGKAQADVFRNEKLGLLHMRAVVNEAGQVTDCRIVELPNPEDKNAQKLCGAVNRAKFQPALDAEGRAVKSFIVLPLASMRRTVHAPQRIRVTR